MTLTAGAAVPAQRCFRGVTKAEGFAQGRGGAARPASLPAPGAAPGLEGSALGELRVGAAPSPSRWLSSGRAGGERAAGMAARGASASGRNKGEFLSDFLCRCLSRLRLSRVRGPCGFTYPRKQVPVRKQNPRRYPHVRICR